MGGRLDFPDGAVRVTPLNGVDDPDAISLSSILNAQHLASALITSFILDVDWLFRHLRPSTRLTLVADQIQHTEPIRSSDFKLVCPEFITPDVQIMHSKLMLLFYAHHMRFVVSTANLVEDEWAVVQNCVFLQDFPMDESTTYAANGFSTALAYSLHDLGVPYRTTAMLNHVDFSRAHVHIVTTVPTGGARKHANMESYGMLRLARVLSPLCPASVAPGEWEPNARLFCVGASLGRLDTNWLRDFYLCAHARDPQPLALAARETAVPDDLVDIAVAFHTREDVATNVYGAAAAQFVVAKQETYASRAFPRSALFRISPRTGDTLVHAKVIVARTGEQQRVGWLYVGSHNFTPAAWGRLRRDGCPYFNNYEFGVVLPDVRYECRGLDRVTSVVWNDKAVPLPFKPIWQPYGRNDTPYFSKHI